MARHVFESAPPSIRHIFDWFEEPDLFSFFPPATPSYFASGSVMTSMSSDPHQVAPKGGHMDPSSLIEKRFVLSPILYAGCYLSHWLLATSMYKIFLLFLFPPSTMLT
jgi:hypothetical protein